MVVEDFLLRDRSVFGQSTKRERGPKILSLVVTVTRYADCNVLLKDRVQVRPNRRPVTLPQQIQSFRLDTPSEP